MRQSLVAGNWKMNGSLESVRELVAGLLDGVGSVANAEVAVCPPSIYLPEVAGLLAGSKITYGSQDVSNQSSGAYTGEISAPMLNDFSCKYAIVGHSERRNGRGESDELVAEKYKMAQEAGIVPILCVGELLEERENGTTEAVVARQLDAVIDNSGVDSLTNAVIAYEPVWAIGTGKTATPDQAQEVHAFIRAKIMEKNADVANKVQILYGGSMKPDNAAELMAKADIDGGLIGGASLKASDFLGICNAAPSA